MVKTWKTRLWSSLVIIGILASFGLGDSQPVVAGQLPDLTIEPIQRTHTETITNTNQAYTINIGNTDITNDSIEISGPVVNPKVLNDDTVDYSSAESIVNEVLAFASDNSELERAKAVWRFHNEYFIEGEIPDAMYWSYDFVDFFNSYGSSICGGSGTLSPQIAESMGQNGRTDVFDSDYMYTIMADGKWATFNSINGDAYFLGRDNESLIANEQITEDFWLHQRSTTLFLHRVTGELSDGTGMDLDKKVLWWKGSRDPNDPFGNNLKDFHRMDYVLRQNESLQRRWPSQGVGAGQYFYPYPGIFRTYDSFIQFQPDLSAPNLGQFFSGSQNIETFAENPLAPRIHASTPGNPSWFILRVDSPYAIYEGHISGRSVRNTANDYVKVYASLDGGSTWQLLGEQTELGEKDFSYTFEILQNEGSNLSHAVEHFSYLVKFEFLSSNQKTDAGLQAIDLKTTLIVNSMTLPGLHRGTNQLAFTADQLNGVITVTHLWNEERLQLTKEIYTLGDQVIPVTLRVANIGDGVSNGGKVRLYLTSRDGQLGNLVGEVTLGQILPGQEQIIQIDVPVPDLVYLTHILTAVIDPDNEVVETNEGNNSRSRLIRLFIRPELLTIPEYVTYYDATKEIKATIWNMGDMAASTFKVNIYEGTSSGGPSRLLHSETVPGILRHEHHLIVVPIDHRPTGIWVEIDPQNQVEEEYELYGLVFSKGTQPPLLDAGPVRSHEVGKPITLTAWATDPDGKGISEYRWEIDTSSYSHQVVDQTIYKNGQSVIHTFSKPGDYMIRLWAVDDDGEKAFDTTLVKVGGNPILPPLPGDLNEDGVVNDLDVELCVQVILGFELNPRILHLADLNQDGQVDTIDLQDIINMELASP